MLEGLRGEMSVAEPCRREGIATNLYYRWSKEFLESGKKRLGGAGGANDFRISDMGGTGNIYYGAFDRAVACNTTENQYLVVWEGDDNIGGLVDNEDEIFGQRVNTITIFADNFESGDTSARSSSVP